MTLSHDIEDKEIVAKRKHTGDAKNAVNYI